MGIQRRDISGNAGTATRLQTARNIGGVLFNGTADINLPGVNAAGNQNTSGNAATATTAAACTGNAATASAVAWTGVTGRPTALSAFTNDPGFITAAGVNTSSVLAAEAGAAVGAVGTYGMLRYESAEAAINPGDVKGGADLRWANVAGNFSGTPAGNWRCMGYASNASSTNRTTLWLRIS